jgi:hypothetical protein
MIRLDWLNKYSLLTAHGRRGVRTRVHTWGGGLGLISLYSAGSRISESPRKHPAKTRTAMSKIMLATKLEVVKRRNKRKLINKAD